MVTLSHLVGWRSASTPISFPLPSQKCVHQWGTQKASLRHSEAVGSVLEIEEVTQSVHDCNKALNKYSVTKNQESITRCSAWNIERIASFREHDSLLELYDRYDYHIPSCCWSKFYSNIQSMNSRRGHSRPIFWCLRFLSSLRNLAKIPSIWTSYNKSPGQMQVILSRIQKDCIIRQFQRPRPELLTQQS